MRIAIFCPTVLGTGGMETAITNLMDGFASLGDTVHLFVFGGSFDECWLKRIPHTQIGSHKGYRIKRLLTYIAGAVSLVFQWDPDVILCADTTTIEIARLGRLINVHKRCIISSWIHFPVAEARFKDRLRRADMHLAISSQIADDLSAYVIDTRRITTIYNALGSIPAHIIMRPEKPVFLYAGRLTFDDQKRVNDILLAVSMLHGSWTLRVVGDAIRGEEEQLLRLRRLASELDIESRVEWLGWQHKPWDAAGSVTAVVSSSAREAFGMTLVEACSHGVACISSDCTGPRDIIAPGLNGWLYPIGDVAALSGLLQQILDGTLQLPSQAAIVSSVERFSAKAVASRARQAFVAALEHSVRR